MTAVPVNLTVELPGKPWEVRDRLLDELRLAGVVARADGSRIVVDWPPGEWEPAEHGRAELRLESTGRGTRVMVELRRDPDLLAAWFVSQAVAPLLRAASPEAYGDWLTDRRARRPSGAEAREVYADPLYHWPNFLAILAELALTADDILLEVGCGGGAFLREALKSGCRAFAVDQSPDMVRLARELNADAIAEERLEILEGDAAALPFANDTCTAAVMTGVLGFLPDPVAVFAEIRRVLAPGGRIVALGSDPAMKGTPAAPEPMASRLQFYEDSALERIGHEAGLDDVRVERIPLGDFAREAGLPEDAVVFFAGPGAPFLLASKH
jgi:SAM-dependent methyltransferase